MRLALHFAYVQYHLQGLQRYLMFGSSSLAISFLCPLSYLWFNPTCFTLEDLIWVDDVCSPCLLILKQDSGLDILNYAEGLEWALMN
jgi:hypothetical protein